MSTFAASLTGALLAAILAGALGLLVPRIIACVPEPEKAEADEAESDEPEPAKELYLDIAEGPRVTRLALAACALVGALIGAAVGVDWALIFLLPLTPVSVALALIDWRTRLLPTRIIAPTYLVLIPLVVLAAFADGEPRPLLQHAAIGWALMGGIYWLLWRIHPAGMGYGDVRLSGILGIALGYLGFGELLLGAWSAFLLGGLGGAVLVGFKIVDKKHNPFGPWMLFGALVGIVAGPAFGVWMWGDLAA